METSENPETITFPPISCIFDRAARFLRGLLGQFVLCCFTGECHMDKKESVSMLDVNANDNDNDNDNDMTAKKMTLTINNAEDVSVTTEINSSTISETSEERLPILKSIHEYRNVEMTPVQSKFKKSATLRQCKRLKIKDDTSNMERNNLKNENKKLLMENSELSANCEQMVVKLSVLEKENHTLKRRCQQLHGRITKVKQESKEEIERLKYSNAMLCIQDIKNNTFHFQDSELL